MLSEIVFGKPDARQVAQQFVTYVEQKEASLVKTPTGKLMQKAEVHGPVCQGTVGALARAKARASDANSKTRDYLVSKALQRWQYQDLGHAWECWYEQHVKLVRLRNLSTRILKRWTHDAKAFGRWHHRHKAYDTKK